MPNNLKTSGNGPRRRNGRSGPGPQPDHYDVIIVGGGPAGLSAALVLARCRRRVLVVDSGRPRNAASRAIHGYLGRDGIPPLELLKLGHVEVDRYGAEVLHAEVNSARGLPAGEATEPGASFEVMTGDGRRLRARKLLLATGVRDVLPPIEGAETYYGHGVHHCPYCDGWEHRDGSLVAYGVGRAAVGLALSLRTWSDRVTACSDGKSIAPSDRKRLSRNGVVVRTEPVVRLEGFEDVLRRVVFRSGPPLECDALFFHTDQHQHSQLPAMLGCEESGRNNQVPTHGKQRTRVPGLFLAGDADGDVQFAIVAAAEGARAAVAINRELQDADRGDAPVPPRPKRKSAVNRD